MDQTRANPQQLLNRWPSRLGRLLAAEPGSAVLYPPRYELMDGVRGMAALAVVLTHHGVQFLGHDAVLVFFIVSGYCIAGAAHSALGSGASGVVAFRLFVWRRVRRIYPPYVLSLAFFAATRLLREHLGRGTGLSLDPMLWLRNLTLTQWTYLIDHPASEPVANPALLVTAHWSLNYEEQFYLVVALCLWICRSRLAQLPVALGVVTIASLLWLGVHRGEGFHGIFFEYWPHFAIGVGLFLVLCTNNVQRMRTIYGATLVYFGMRAAAAALGWLPHTSDRLMSDFTVIGFAGAALLIARPWSQSIASHALWKPVAALGTISYSLYLVHQFNLTFTNAVADRVLGPAAAPALHLCVAIAAQLALATAFWYVCERPFVRRRSAAPAP